MNELQKLKHKYSGQAIPEWELELLAEKTAPAEQPKRRGRPPKVRDEQAETVEPVSDDDDNA